MKPVSNNSYFTKFITRMTKADAMEPIIGLEATVLAGRTFQAYRRGGTDEARERFLEESTGSIVWLGGVVLLNKIGDIILEKLLNKPNAKFDVGTDKILRTPFENFMKKAAPKRFSPTGVAMLKGAKVLTSILIANWFIGFVVPKINHTITNKVIHNRKLLEEQQQKNDNKGLTFKGGGLSALNTFTNAIENTNTGKLLSTDAGIAGGRMYNARSKEERREIAIRDIGSIYFYMWAQGHVGNILSYIETGKWTRLNPISAETFDEYLNKYLESKGGSLTVEEFKKDVLGKKASEIKIREDIKFNTGKLSAYDKFMNNFRTKKAEPLQVAKVSELEKIFTDKELLSRISGMSKLQPQRLGESVITKNQLIDAINKAEINNPELLDKIYDEFTQGANKNEFKFVSNSKLEKLKKEMEEYVERICKESKDGKVDKELLKKVKQKNITYSGINFAAGFIVAASFLSTFIPKIQYYITQKATGENKFPGTYDYEHHREMVA